MTREDRIAGLATLRREVEPPADLWPGIESRIRPRRKSLPAWGGLALAASLLVAVALPLRQTAIHTPAASAAGSRTAYFLAQFKELEGAQRELLLALEQRPQSPGLRRLLESTRQRQRDLRRLALA